MSLALALEIIAFVLFVLGTVGWPVSRFNLIAAGLAVLTFAVYLLPHIG